MQQQSQEQVSIQHTEKTFNHSATGMGGLFLAYSLMFRQYVNSELFRGPFNEGSLIVFYVFYQVYCVFTVILMIADVIVRHFLLLAILRSH